VQGASYTEELWEALPLGRVFVIFQGLRRGRNTFAFDVEVLLSLSTGKRK
jgi:hypothetical protein